MNIPDDFRKEDFQLRIPIELVPLLKDESVINALKILVQDVSQKHLTAGWIDALQWAKENPDKVDERLKELTPPKDV